MSRFANLFKGRFAKKSDLPVVYHENDDIYECIDPTNIDLEADLGWSENEFDEDEDIQISYHQDSDNSGTLKQLNEIFDGSVSSQPPIPPRGNNNNNKFQCQPNQNAPSLPQRAPCIAPNNNKENNILNKNNGIIKNSEIKNQHIENSEDEENYEEATELFTSNTEQSRLSHDPEEENYEIPDTEVNNNKNIPPIKFNEPFNQLNVNCNSNFQTVPLKMNNNKNMPPIKFSEPINRINVNCNTNSQKVPPKKTNKSISLNEKVIPNIHKSLPAPPKTLEEYNDEEGDMYEISNAEITADKIKKPPYENTSIVNEFKTNSSNQSTVIENVDINKKKSFLFNNQVKKGLDSTCNEISKPDIKKTPISTQLNNVFDQKQIISQSGNAFSNINNVEKSKNLQLKPSIPKKTYTIQSKNYDYKVDVSNKKNSPSFITKKDNIDNHKNDIKQVNNLLNNIDDKESNKRNNITNLVNKFIQKEITINESLKTNKITANIISNNHQNNSLIIDNQSGVQNAKSKIIDNITNKPPMKLNNLNVKKVNKENINIEVVQDSQVPVLSRIIKEEENSIYNFNWYFGGLSRNESESKLNILGKDGSFLVRKSQKSKGNTPYSLTILFRDNFFNLQIRQREDKRWAIGSEKYEERSFYSVQEMIQYHQENPIEIVADSRKNIEAGKVFLKFWPNKK